jgi:hypothetical protein
VAYVSVPIPEERVAEVYALLSGKLETIPTGQAYEEEPLPIEPKLARAPWGMGPGLVKKAFLGGASEYWKPFLTYLHDYPDEWINQDDVIVLLEMEPTSFPGFLGAAERRCKKRPPYVKKRINDRVHFMMPRSVAEVIEGLL